MKYKVGDRVRVISSTNGHKFNIGEIVTIEKLYPDANPPHYKARNSGDFWWVMDENIEDIKSRSEQFRERLEKYKKELEPIEFPDWMIDNIMDAYNEVHQ